MRLSYSDLFDYNTATLAQGKDGRNRWQGGYILMIACLQGIREQRASGDCTGQSTFA